jgi:hypothetical protein
VVQDPFPKFPYPHAIGGPLTNNAGQSSLWVELSDMTGGLGTMGTSAEFTMVFEVPPGCTASGLSLQFLINMAPGA